MNIPARKLPPPLPPRAQKKRQKSTHPILIIKFCSNSRQEAIEQYFPDVTLGGMFVRTAVNPRLAPGKRIRLRFVLKNGTSYEAQGLVAWIEQGTASQGLGIKFLHLSFASEQFFGDMINRRQAAMVQQASQAQYSLEAAIAESEFTNAPTWKKQQIPLMI